MIPALLRRLPDWAFQEYFYGFLLIAAYSYEILQASRLAKIRGNYPIHLLLLFLYCYWLSFLANATFDLLP